MSEFGSFHKPQKNAGKRGGKNKPKFSKPQESQGSNLSGGVQKDPAFAEIFTQPKKANGWSSGKNNGKSQNIGQKSKQPAKKENLVDKQIEEKARAKENELQQITDMFGEAIDKEVIQDFWANLNQDYEQTISMLSDMVEDIEKAKKEEQKRKEEQEHKTFQKKTDGRLKLRPNCKPFRPGKEASQKPENPEHPEEELKSEAKADLKPPSSESKQEAEVKEEEEKEESKVL
mmetsp:Transcript_32806/g.37541  ORF Transcript_32806/g.37541 Transcript_32806/m.37541 type:complete len:231 (+) Transcript_32806:25-717(+)